METETAPKPAVADDATTSKLAVNIFPVAKEPEVVLIVETLKSFVEVAIVLDNTDPEAEIVELDDVVTSAEDGVSKAVTTDVDKMELPLASVLAKMEIFM